MISLRRNDKIIIIVGVIILLVAGIGVALYSSPNVKTPFITQTTWTTYSVSWRTVDDSLPQITDLHASKGSPLSTIIRIDQTNLKSISFRLKWVDDKALLRRFGLDTLTLDVTTPLNKTISDSGTSAKKTKAGDFTINISILPTPPQINSIQANNTAEAGAMLQSLFKDDSWSGKPINATVSVKIGEHFPFKFRDKGNGFTLDVNYSYYTYAIQENITGTGLDGLSDDLSLDNDTSWTPPYMSMIIGTGCGRYI